MKEIKKLEYETPSTTKTCVSMETDVMNTSVVEDRYLIKTMGHEQGDNFSGDKWTEDEWK